LELLKAVVLSAEGSISLPVPGSVTLITALLALGALVAVLVCYWRDWLACLAAGIAASDTCSTQEPDTRLAPHVLAETIPAFVAGPWYELLSGLGFALRARWGVGCSPRVKTVCLHRCPLLCPVWAALPRSGSAAGGSARGFVAAWPGLWHMNPAQESRLPLEMFSPRPIYARVIPAVSTESPLASKSAGGRQRRIRSRVRYRAVMPGKPCLLVALLP
jgi:hypothetical protein